MNILKALALSPSQAQFLKSKGGSFHIGESLRKRGLLERHTLLVVRSEYADENSIHGHTYRKPDPRHEWYTTTAGDFVLDLLEKNK